MEGMNMNRPLYDENGALVDTSLKMARAREVVDADGRVVKSNRHPAGIIVSDCPYCAERAKRSKGAP